MISQLWTITRGTFIEALRQPIYVVMLLVGVMLLAVMNPALTAFTFGEEDKLLVNIGLSTALLCGLFLASFTTSGVLELEDQTILNVLSKPIPRPVFIAGKYLGAAAALGAAFWVWALVFLLTVRHGILTHAYMEPDYPVIVFGLGAGLAVLIVATAGNYLYGWRFPSTLSLGLAAVLPLAYGLVLLVDKHWAIQSPSTDLNWQILAALLLVFEALLILAAVALAAATRLKMVMTLLVCVLVCVLGIVNEPIFGRWAADGSLFAQAAYLLAPNLQILWLADALALSHAVDLSFVLMTLAYTGLYTFAVVCLAAALFQQRETG
jgi:hypothetical protein